LCSVGTAALVDCFKPRFDQPEVFFHFVKRCLKISKQAYGLRITKEKEEEEDDDDDD